MKKPYDIVPCISCLEEKYVIVMTEIDIDIFICDDCLEKVEKAAKEGEE
jgi:hypothetical protein